MCDLYDVVGKQLCDHELNITLSTDYISLQTDFLLHSILYVCVCAALSRSTAVFVITSTRNNSNNNFYHLFSLLNKKPHSNTYNRCLESNVSKIALHRNDGKKIESNNKKEREKDVRCTYPCVIAFGLQFSYLFITFQ